MSRQSDNADPAADQPSLEEQLVAYLDGELDDEASRRIEQLLAAEPKVRETLEKLEATWGLLDHLGQADLDEVFTRSTLEMVAVAAADDVQKQEADAPRRRRRRWLIGGASLMTAAAAGFLAVAMFWPSPNEQLLHDLPMLENYDEYRQIGDFQFLQLLLDEGDELFGEEVEDGS
jgi:anti-sigma factor RsiW